MIKKNVQVHLAPGLKINKTLPEGDVEQFKIKVKELFGNLLGQGLSNEEAFARCKLFRLQAEEDAIDRQLREDLEKGGYKF